MSSHDKKVPGSRSTVPGTRTGTVGAFLVGVMQDRYELISLALNLDMRKKRDLLQGRRENW